LEERQEKMDERTRAVFMKKVIEEGSKIAFFTMPERGRVHEAAICEMITLRLANSSEGIRILYIVKEGQPINERIERLCQDLSFYGVIVTSVTDVVLDFEGFKGKPATQLDVVMNGIQSIVMLYESM
jgi:hypothetical protein